MVICENQDMLHWTLEDSFTMLVRLGYDVRAVQPNYYLVDGVFSWQQRQQIKEICGFVECVQDGQYIVSISHLI